MGKWHLHRFYSKSPDVRKHLPPTALLHKRSLKRFLNRYQAVYIKPDGEHQGRGIMKALKTPSGYALTLVNGTVVTRGSFDGLYFEILKRSPYRRYIIQKAISLARIKGRPLDIRTMMMRNTKNQWEFFGLYAKVAGPESIVTNLSRTRGYVLPFGTAMKRSLGYSKIRSARVQKRLARLSYKICKFAGRIKYYRKIGIDFGVDQKGKVWLIEVNFTYPGFKGFARLPDKSAYRRIKRMNEILKKRK